MNAGSSSVMGGGGGGRGRKWRVPEDDTLQIVDPKRGKGKVGNPVSYNLFIYIDLYTNTPGVRITQQMLDFELSVFINLCFH